MRIDPYLNFKSNCAEAMRVYADLLGATDLTVMTFRESPIADQVAEHEKDLVIHARFSVGDFRIMGSDAPGARYSEPKGFAVSIGVDSPAEAERIFAALAEGGHVGMPLAETFWARRFGIVVDRFGTCWMVNCE